MIGWALETLAASTALMLLVLALRRPVAAAFGARIAYALWALPALRLVLPPLPGWSPFWATAPVAPVIAVPAVDPVAAATFASPAEPALDLLLLLALVWVVGGFIWFGWQMLRYRRFVARALGDSVPLEDDGPVVVLVSPAVAGPMAAGIRHRRIFLPADFATRYTADERRLALAHENAHHARGDLLANLAGLVVLALHWWNPVAHWAWRAFRADQELACDATVLAGAAPEHRLAYGRAVLKSACGATPAAACAMNHKNQLKQRLVMMKPRSLGAARLFTGALSAFALIGGGLVLTASGSAQAIPAPPAPAAAPPAPAAAPTAPAAAPTVPAPPVPAAAPAPPAPPQVIIIRDGKISKDGAIVADGIKVIGSDPGKGGTQIKTIIMTRTDRGAAAAVGGRRVVVRCIRTARIENGKTVVTDATSDCASPDLLDIGAITAEAMQEAGVQTAMVRPTIAAALREARADIAGNSDLSVDQRVMALAGLDIAIKENFKINLPAK